MLSPEGAAVDPLIETLPAGSTLYRVHGSGHPADAFNPGTSPAQPSARFSFFGDPPVPALHAADTVDGALSETLLREVPLEGGSILLDQVEGKALSPIITVRALRLLQLHGHGFRHLKVGPAHLTLASPRQYPHTVPWGQAAFEAGLDGIVWMSRHHNSSRVYVFYDRPNSPGTIDVHPDQVTARAFSLPEHLDWLTRRLDPLDVAILDPS